MESDKISLEKKELRKRVLADRKRKSEEERTRAGEELSRKLAKTDVYASASCVLIYVNYRDELPTIPLIQRMLQDGKKVFVPKVFGPMEMEFYKIESLSELEKGYMGIPEPKEGLPDFSTMLRQIKEQSIVEENSVIKEKHCAKAWKNASASKVWMIMPGVAFDRQGNRMGYGGGFYDHYLLEHGNEIDVVYAVGFACQQVDSLPTEIHDQKPDRVILV